MDANNAKEFIAKLIKEKEKNNNGYSVTVTGWFGHIKENFEPLTGVDGQIYGFKLPNGNIVRPVIALEIESHDGYADVNSEVEMENLGFKFLNYNETKFEKADND